MDKIPVPPRARYVLARMQQEIVGLAQDFWKDGHWHTPDLEGDLGGDVSSSAFGGIDDAAQAQAHAGESIDPSTLWNALAGEISEKMWGALCVAPGDAHITQQLVEPLALTKDMNLLDISAGLGGRLRKTADQYGIYIDGMEADPAIAARGTELSKATRRAKPLVISPYDPATLASARTYDCVVARETIYRAADKVVFINAIAACCKKKAQISFTDYIIDSEVSDKPGIIAWKAFEQAANPTSLVEMAELWAKAGFTLRVHEDQSDYYKKEVLKGLARFAKFLATADRPPSPETKQAINKQIATWAHRVAALEAGMKFYRFYGLK